MNEQNHYDHDCKHEFKPEVYCDCLGLKVDEEDLLETEGCPICFGNGDNLFHECKWCGERISHEGFLGL